MERRFGGGERRKAKAPPAPAERRVKPRRKARKLVGSPPSGAMHIDAADQYALDYWSKHLGVSHEAISSAVREVGSTVEAVRKHLRK